MLLVYAWINTNASQSNDCKAFVVLGAGTKPIFKEKTRECKCYLNY